MTAVRKYLNTLNDQGEGLLPAHASVLLMPWNDPDRTTNSIRAVAATARRDSDE
jgi:hypothetical protein